MFETLFGAEVSPALKFFLAFVIVLALIGVTAWLVRRFGAERFGGSSARGRQPRLGVVDAAAVDARRKLVIIRRDNVEHLLMIGGPTDVVIEQNIVRAMGAPRDKVEPSLARALPTAETLTRPVPLGEGTCGRCSRSRKATGARHASRRSRRNGPGRRIPNRSARRAPNRGRRCRQVLGMNFPRDQYRRASPRPRGRSRRPLQTVRSRPRRQHPHQQNMSRKLKKPPLPNPTTTPRTWRTGWNHRCGAQASRARRPKRQSP